MSIAPLKGVDNLSLLAQRMRIGDVASARLEEAGLLNFFPRQIRMMVFTLEHDGDMPGVLEKAGLCRCQMLGFNAEGIEPALILARLQAVYAAVGGRYPLVFGPTYSNFNLHYKKYLPFCEWIAVQLQKAPLDKLAALAAKAVENVKAVKAEAGVLLQLPAFEPMSREQIIAAARSVEGLDMAVVTLYFGNASQWDLCESALDELRPPKKPRANVVRVM